MKKTNLTLLLTAAMSGMFCACQPKDNTLTKAEQEEGWELLFNGQDLSEWRNYNDTVLSNGWAAVDGCIQASGEGVDASGYIVTKRKFKDFVKVGLPMNLIVFLVSVLLIPLFYHLV